MIAREVIEEIAVAMEKATGNDTLILAGDLNCRIDKPCSKAIAVLDFLEEK